MNYFNQSGRRVPESGDRVFSKTPNNYYKLIQPNLDYKKIYDLANRFSNEKIEISCESFANTADGILKIIKSNPDFANLLGGVHVPFLIKQGSNVSDLGLTLQESLLPSVKKSFVEKYPNAYFKAILQSSSELKGNISLAQNCNYDELHQASKEKTVVGWYFPQAFQEFDIESQRKQVISLPKIKGASLCLSGGADVCAALVGSPDLLISEEFYAPMICMSAYVHSDPRMVLFLKSYGPHLEFWCMTQMLTKDITQVSEQWTGGLTIFT